MKKVILPAIIIVMLLFAFTATYLYAEENVHSAESPLALTEPRAQFFCGYCHILSYPRVIEKAYTSWRAGKHKDVGCVKCHYPPETLDYKIPQHKKIPKDRRAARDMRTEMEYMKTELEVLSRLTTVLNMKEAVVRKAPRIDDRSCTASKCHPSTGEGKEGEYWTKKIEFATYEKADKTKVVIPYVHKTHFDSTKYVEGQVMHCTSCHQRETGQNHFEVNREKCFLCHFKNVALNEERAKCALCHEVPTAPLQKQKKEGAGDEEKPITHKSIEEAKVPCESCHLHLTSGRGEIREKNCLDCHDNDEPVKKEIGNKKLMHEKHVAGQTAHCFNCHEPIAHRESDFMDAARGQCTACHPDHHRYQVMLLAGKGGKGIPDTPSQMFSVKTNCLGCHKGEKIVHGEPVVHGTGKTCAACHTEKHEAMAKDWKKTTDAELKGAKEIEKEALEAVENAKGKAPKEKLKKAAAMVKDGQEYLQLVEYGGGVHNTKYSVTLLDEAMNKFEDAIDLLGEE
jgi:hypothetical protein